MRSVTVLFLSLQSQYEQRQKKLCDKNTFLPQPIPIEDLYVIVFKTEKYSPRFSINILKAHSNIHLINDRN